VRGVYDRYEFYAEKQHAFEALAGLIGRIVNPQENVLPLRDRRLPAADHAQGPAPKSLPDDHNSVATT
jgi:hypothetical protein